MAYTSRRNTRGYRVSGRDMLSYGYKYGEPWADDKRALERAFRELDLSHEKPGGAWTAHMAAHERRGHGSTGSYRGDSGKNNGGMEVVRVGGHFPSSNGSHDRQYPLPTPMAAGRASSVSRNDTYDYRDTARTFVGSGSGWENYDSPRMGKRSRGPTAQVPPLGVYPPSSCGSWRSESPYGDDPYDRNATRPGPHLEEHTMYSSGANVYSQRANWHWRHEEYGSHVAPAGGYARNGSELFSDYGSEDPGSGSESKYTESTYYDSDYGGETETYLSDGESYDFYPVEEDISSEGIYSGSEAGSDSEYWISDGDDEYSD